MKRTIKEMQRSSESLLAAQKQRLDAKLNHFVQQVLLLSENMQDSWWIRTDLQVIIEILGSFDKLPCALQDSRFLGYITYSVFAPKKTTGEHRAISTYLLSIMVEKYGYTIRDQQQLNLLYNFSTKKLDLGEHGKAIKDDAALIVVCNRVNAVVQGFFNNSDDEIKDIDKASNDIYKHLCNLKKLGSNRVPGSLYCFLETYLNKDKMHSNKGKLALKIVTKFMNAEESFVNEKLASSLGDLLTNHEASIPADVLSEAKKSYAKYQAYSSEDKENYPLDNKMPFAPIKADALKSPNGFQQSASTAGIKYKAGFSMPKPPSDGFIY